MFRGRRGPVPKYGGNSRGLSFFDRRGEYWRWFLLGSFLAVWWWFSSFLLFAVVVVDGGSNTVVEDAFFLDDDSTAVVVPVVGCSGLGGGSGVFS